MTKETFLDKVRSLVGRIAWLIFLWSINTKQEEYINSITVESLFIKAEKIVEAINKRLNITPSVELYNELVNIVKLELNTEFTFDEVVKPVIEWLAKNQHPHTTVIIDAVHAELVEGIECFHTEEFLQD